MQWLEIKNKQISDVQNISPQSTTAILIFSRQAGEEADQKHFAQLLDAKAGVKIAASLLTHTEEQAEASLLPVIRCYSREQRGENFGERLSNAIEEAFENGYERLIVTGSDTPHISTKIFQHVAAALQSDKLILGPSTDGGVYLIGIHKSIFKRDLFRDIPWLTSRVTNALQQYAACVQANIVLLEALDDVDDLRSLRRFSSIRKNWLSCLIGQLFAAAKHKQSLWREVIFTECVHSLFGFRGPPAIGSAHYRQ